MTFVLYCWIFIAKMQTDGVFWILLGVIYLAEAALMGDQCDWTGRYVDFESSILILVHAFPKPTCTLYFVGT